MKFRQTFDSRADFERLKNGAARFPARFFIANAAPARTNPAKYGMVATIKSFDTAVKRNRARRLMREWLRLSGKLDPALDYSFVLRPHILDAKAGEGQKELSRALGKLREMI
ncbi:MAG: ribonuclease P protein component [Rickettsiales bacterium]|jgi:ribonuclease P protein component|nr:ribonuclease P protein component [Rickettsiales bacterium]